jgi:hypothetical protein
MKNWRILVFGVAGFSIFVFLPFHEHIFAAAAAILIIAGAVLGFLWQPASEIFYVQTVVFVEGSAHRALRRDRIAVKAELARLWLLFLPTIIAVGFLLIIFARGAGWWGIFWNVKPIQLFLENGGVFAIWLLDAFLGGVILLLSAWLGERWVLRNADACSAKSLRKDGRRMYYGFQDPSGEWYGGYGFPFSRNYAIQLRSLVFYRADTPQQNKLAMCCLFHRFAVVGRGVRDFDEANVAVYSAQPASADP